MFNKIISEIMNANLCKSTDLAVSLISCSFICLLLEPRYKFDRIPVVIDF